MSANNESIIDILKFTLNSDLSIMYKKVYLKKYISQYMNNTNEEEFKNMIKENNNDIYEYLFLPKTEKTNYKQQLEKQKIYIEENKEKIKEAKRKYYYKHREEQLNKCKENYRKKKEILKNQLEENK